MQTLSFGKKMVAAVFVGLAIYFILNQFGIGPAFRRQAASVPTKFALSNDAPAPAAATPAPAAFTGCGNGVAKQHGSVIHVDTIPWNAIMGFALSNCGPRTVNGSLMDKAGVTVEIKRVDDSGTSQASQAKFAADVAAGVDTPDGPAFVVIMGDGSAQYMAALNKLTAKLGPDYYAENVGHVGRSHGEDGWWGPQSWADSCEAMKGGTTVGVILDGDWNIALYKLAICGIKNNPDVTTWDPDGMNWIAADDFKKAVEMWMSGYCEDRPVVRNGKLTNEPKHHTCGEAYVTWTPADVTGAHGKGGLVRLLSTGPKENANQMPATLIGIHKWDVAHARQVKALLGAALEGGRQVRGSDDALQRAAKASWEIYGREETAGWWAKYYRGVIEPDKTGVRVPLGGSIADTLPDVLAYYGLLEGTGGLSNSLWRATYEGFGNIARQQYPRRVPDFPPYDKAFNATFLTALASEASPADTDTAKADLPKFTEGAIEKADVIAQRNWNIVFDTNSAVIRPDQRQMLDEIYTELLQGSALAVEFDGHTDNTGNHDANIDLSFRRAASVRDYMKAKAPALFPANRVTVQGFGDTKPIASNATVDGRAQNRRVTVILGTK